MEKATDTCRTIRIALYCSLLGTIATSLALIFVLISPAPRRMSLDEAKTYAVKLADSELYSQAVAEYRRILDEYRLSDRDEGSILYQIGTICAEKLHDPASAVSAFLQILQLHPNHPLIDDVNRKLIAQLDKMGKTRQAQSILQRSVSLGKPLESVGDTAKIVAKIGDRVITADEVEKALDELPAEVAGQFADKAARGRFLHDYVGQQLLFDAALRAGYDQRPEIVDQLESARKNVIIAAFFKDRIADRAEVSASDIEVYYKMHKSEFGDQPLEEVRAQVEQSLRYQRMSELQQGLFDELLKAEKVQLFPENMIETGE